jgi:hypothetical protein
MDARRPHSPGPQSDQSVHDDLREARRAENSHGHLARHLITTVSIKPIGKERAEGAAYALVFRDEQYRGVLPSSVIAPEAVVEFHDVFVQTPHGWRIATQQTTQVFLRPLAGGRETS